MGSHWQHSNLGNSHYGEWMFLPYGIILHRNTPWGKSCNERAETTVNPGKSCVALTSYDFLSFGQPQRPLHCPLAVLCTGMSVTNLRKMRGSWWLHGPKAAWKSHLLKTTPL